MMSDSNSISYYANKIYDLKLVMCGKEYNEVKTLQDLKKFLGRWSEEEYVMYNLGRNESPPINRKFIKVVIPGDMKNFSECPFPVDFDLSEEEIKSENFYLHEEKIQSWDKTHAIVGPLYQMVRVEDILKDYIY